ncbi:MAG TPA: isocitrate lyase/phosphoenolpyruvate mutase family protein [Solirubrobacterales bacterium]|nr:isocitrate lyase/phosphoenolpyruvate mutase family protein [Solirubrobacterales bacterium]
MSCTRACRSSSPTPGTAVRPGVFEALGFAALATTSSGLAFTLGRLDGTVTLEEIEAHVRLLDSVSGLPVSVDLENGYGPSPEDAARAIVTVAAAGAVGGSIEDYDRDEGRLYELEEASERIAAAAEAAAALDFPFTLTARAENFLRGNPDLDDTVARLRAYEEAGADVLYAPGLKTIEEVRAVCAAVAKPVNVLARPNFALDELVEAGAQRVSVGGSLAWSGVEAAAAAAEAIRDRGDFSGLGSLNRVREWLMH